MMRIILASSDLSGYADDIEMMPSKQDLIDRVNSMVKQYGRRRAADALRRAFESSGSWYREDKRLSGAAFALHIIEGYKDNIPKHADDLYYKGMDMNLFHRNSSDCDYNQDILKALNDSSKWVRDDYSS